MTESAATALYVLAYTLLENARSEQASMLLEALDAVNPGQPRTLLALAAAQLRLGRCGEALHTLERLAREGYREAPLQLLRSQALGALGRHSQAHAAMSEYLLLRTTPFTHPLRTRAA